MEYSLLGNFYEVQALADPLPKHLVWLVEINCATVAKFFLKKAVADPMRTVNNINKDLISANFCVVSNVKNSITSYLCLSGTWF